MMAYWGGGIAPRILDLGIRWSWVVSFTPRPLYSQGKSPWYPLDRRLGGSQSRSGRGGDEKNSQHLSELELRIIQRNIKLLAVDAICLTRKWKWNTRKRFAWIFVCGALYFFERNEVRLGDHAVCVYVCVCVPLLIFEPVGSIFMKFGTNLEYLTTFNYFEIWVFQGGEDSSRGLMGCDVCSDVLGYQPFRGPCRLLKVDPTTTLHGVTTQKTSTWTWITTPWRRILCLIKERTKKTYQRVEV
jgi:hypothetical protein